MCGYGIDARWYFLSFGQWQQVVLTGIAVSQLVWFRVSVFALAESADEVVGHIQPWILPNTLIQLLPKICKARSPNAYLTRHLFRSFREHEPLSWLWEWDTSQSHNHSLPWRKNSPVFVFCPSPVFSFKQARLPSTCPPFSSPKIWPKAQGQAKRPRKDKHFNICWTFSVVGNPLKDSWSSCRESTIFWSHSNQSCGTSLIQAFPSAAPTF